jgi:hypothetical protein
VDQGAATGAITKLLASGPLAWIVRIGYVARGILFLIIGGFALLAAGGLGAHPRGTRDALEFVFQKPFGGYFLWTLAAGLSCFAGWRFLQSVFDVDRHGSNLYGLTRRCVLAGSGLFYIALAVATAHITVEQRRMGEDQAAREWTSWLMKQPLGHGLIALIATGFVGVAIGLAVNAFRSPYIAIGSMRGRQHLALALALALGSFGTLTRAFVFLLLGGFLGVAAYDSNSEEAASLAGVLRAMQSQPYGGVLLGIAALGLIAFGCFEVIESATRTAKVLRGARSKINVSRR